MDVGWTSAAVAVIGAVVAVASLVVTVVEGVRARRHTKFLAHHDHWWQRWSWIAERALSDDDTEQDAAAFMAHAVLTRSWSTPDDKWMDRALDDHEVWASNRRRKETHHDR
ncbi:hypothetical protein [Curtobacterium sp. B8]|uniref:hypothetical protein n=1 Tax=Curtobacterium sp. B8 TaxID=95611 RepID=UPI0003B4BC00|nr:hypothetical protein [Curtobacterium sp. B8]